ncbi:MAG: sugar phosphate isomerase/epimerase [Ruminococcaceae bacterium]|nr:sugar phosphate isomerase/epimerase [Oscillospiraceae bacterium]
MSNIKVGIQTHCVREDFAEDPAKTLKRIADIGYEGIETTWGALKDAKVEDTSAEFYIQALKDANLKCFSIMISWNTIEDGELDTVIDYCKKLGCEVLIIGGGVAQLPWAENGVEYQKEVLEKMDAAVKKIQAAGLLTGFHNHDCDHTTTVDGEKAVFDFLMENTDDDYMMMIDTGNTQGGGADPIALIEKYPHRTQYVHFKGYSSELGYLTPIWQAEIDSDKLIDTLINKGNTRVFSIEFGKRGEYIPFERAEKSYEWLSAKLKEKGLI